MRRLVLLMVTMIGCGDAGLGLQPQAPGPAPGSPQGAASPPDKQVGAARAGETPGAAPKAVGSSPLVSASCVGIRWGKPPLRSHYFDVTLRNPADGPRWLILPETFPYEGAKDPYPGQGAMAELQVFQVARAPRVVLGLAVAIGGFWAVKLPAGGTLTLRELPIDAFWEEGPKAVDLEVIVAREITAGGQPLGTRFGADALSETGADAKAPRDAADPRALSFWNPSDGKSVPIRFDEESRARVSVPLSCGNER